MQVISSEYEANARRNISGAKRRTRKAQVKLNTILNGGVKSPFNKSKVFTHLKLIYHREYIVEQKK